MNLIATLSLAALGGLLLGSCRKSGADAASNEPDVPLLERNQLSGAPSTFLQSAAGSPVHWQRWEPEVLEEAQSASRLVLALIGSSRYPGCYEALQVIDRTPSLTERMNRDFVPVLVDLDVSREAALLAAVLAPETGLPVGFPFLLLLSPEGAPVSWHPLETSDETHLVAFLESSMEVMSRLWNESQPYIIGDSAQKLAMRRESQPAPEPEVADAAELSERYVDSLRRVTSYFDFDLGTLANSGGLFPSGIFDLLATAQLHPDLPPELRRRSEEVLAAYAAVLLRSAMIDPLDGGIYSLRRGENWNHPVFLRDCATQARAIRALARAAQLGIVPEALPIAENAARFAEARFRTPSGLFSLSGTPAPTPQKEWLWTEEQIASVLTAAERQVWSEVSQIQPIGNLAPSSEFFRLNSLRTAEPVAAVAARLGLSAAAAEQLFESGRSKLLAARNARSAPPAVDPTPSAAASFRMISAYAALFAATANEDYARKATELGAACRQTFGSSRFLNELSGGDAMSDGRAFTYAVAIQGALDLGAITLDDAWNLWAQDLATLLAEHFLTEEGRLLQTRPESQVVDLDVGDRLMTFDESTSGLLRLNLSRLQALGFELPPAIASFSRSMPDTNATPLVYTDSLQALSHRLSARILHVAPGASAEVKESVVRLPLDLFQRRVQTGTDAPLIWINAPSSPMALSRGEEILRLTQPAP